MRGSTADWGNADFAFAVEIRLLVVSLVLVFAPAMGVLDRTGRALANTSAGALAWAEGSTFFRFALGPGRAAPFAIGATGLACFLGTERVCAGSVLAADLETGADLVI